LFEAIAISAYLTEFYESDPVPARIEWISLGSKKWRKKIRQALAMNCLLKI
jgi:hypothetical protein